MRAVTTRPAFALAALAVGAFAIGTGDSDFTPLMHKLRGLDKRVI
ncbi:NYN domain-containing protein, partial [Microbacterium sp. HSID17254]